MDEYDGGTEFDGGSLEIVPGAWVKEVEEFSAVSYINSTLQFE